jgi:predicted dehydrogenase
VHDRRRLQPAGWFVAARSNAFVERNRRLGNVISTIGSARASIGAAPLPLTLFHETEPAKALSVVVVGAGLMGRWHADAAVRAGATVEAVVDRDLARAELLAARFSTSIATPQLSAALAGRRISVVHLCSPLATHESLACEAIEAGCHVLVEKPLAPTLDATRRLFDFAKAHGVLLCPVHQFLFQPGTLRIFRLLPRLGPVRHIDLTICSAGADGQSDALRDQVAFDILPHPLSLLARLLGSQFTEIGWHVGRAAAGELRLSGVAPGVTAGVVVSMNGRPTLNLLRVVAERGSVSSDLFHGFATVERGTVSRVRKVLRPLSTSTVNIVAAVGNLGSRMLEGEYAYPGLRELVRRLYLAVAEEGASPISAADTLAVAAARDNVMTFCRMDASKST